VPTRASREGRRLAGRAHRGREGSRLVGWARALDPFPPRALDHRAPLAHPRMNAPLPAGLAERLKALLGERGFVEGAERAPHEVDWRDLYHGRAALVLKPASTEEVARAVAMLAEARVGIVPQGGNTSLCGASVP